MITQKFIIRAKCGLHARPAVLFVNKCKEFKSEIKIIKDEKEVDAKKFLQVLSLGIIQNTEIIITFKGEDEKIAKQEIEELIKNLM